MEDIFVSSRASHGGAIPKTKSKFYSELSFEDDFNPTSYELRNKSLNEYKNAVAEQPDGLEKTSTPPAEPKTMNDISGHRIRQPGSPLMCYVVRLKHGDELRKSLLAFVKKNGLKAAFVMSCVGSAISSRIRLASARADNEANYMLDIVNPTEIISLSGTLSGGGHLHIGLGESTGRMVGGHLLELYVDTTAEVVIGDCSALSFTRVFDQTTGFHELQVADR